MQVADFFVVRGFQLTVKNGNNFSSAPTGGRKNVDNASHPLKNTWGSLNEYGEQDEFALAKIHFNCFEVVAK